MLNGINDMLDKQLVGNNFIESLSDCNAIDLANDQLAGHPNKHELVNQVNIKTRTDSLKVEDSFINPKEFIDESRETSVVEKEDLHARIEETTLNSASELENLIFVKETKPLEFSIHGQSYYGSSDSASGVSVKIKNTNKIDVKRDPCLIYEENNTSLSSAEALNSMSVGEAKLSKASFFKESTDLYKGDNGVLVEVSQVVSSASCKRYKNFRLQMFFSF